MSTIASLAGRAMWVTLLALAAIACCGEVPLMNIERWMSAACALTIACSSPAMEHDAGRRDDAGEPEPIDAATSPTDSGPSDSGSSSEPDSGSPDAAVQSVDAGSPVTDAGPPSHDAGAPVGTIGSAGCGTPATGGNAFVTRTIDVRGRSRTYHLRIPPSYDRDRAYPIVFRWHGWGGNGMSGGLDIEYPAGDDAIVVGADAIDGIWDLSADGADVALFDALLAALGGELCVDLDRVFSYGFSRGGGFTNLLACIRPGIVRGSAAVAGLEPWWGACNGPVAVWLLHDAGDGAVPIDQGIRSRDRFLAANGCSATTAPADPAPCVRYQGCADPVVWCQTTGYGHNPRGDLAPAAVWSFFRSLP